MRGASQRSLAATVINSVIRSRYSKEHEKEADRIGTELALARGFDPEEAVRFWERQHERFREEKPQPEDRKTRSSVPIRGTASVPRNLRALLAADLKSRDRRQADCWWTGYGHPALRQPSARRSSRRCAGKGTLHHHNPGPDGKHN